MPDPDKPRHDASDDLSIHREELDDVLAIAAKLQQTARDQGDETFEGDEIDTITDTTGVSREALAEAKQLLDERRRRQRQWLLGAVGGVLALTALSAGLWWPRLFPPDPAVVAMEAQQLVTLARGARKNDQHHEALAHALDATRKDPANFEAWNLAGLSYAATDRPGEARAAYEKGIAVAGIRHEAANLYYNLGYLLGDTATTRAEALAAYEKALACDPEFTKAYNNIGWTHNEMGNYDKARHYYREALKADPTNATAFDNLRSVEARLRPKADAAELKRRLLAGQARERVYQLNNAKRYPEAIRAAKAALERYPDAVLIWNDLAMAYENSDQPVEAAKAYARGLEVDDVSPEASYPFYNLGRLAADAGHHDDAVRYYQQAIMRRPNYGWAHYNLGKEYEKLGQRDKAIAAYQLAVSNDGNVKRAEAALRRLKAQ